MLLLLCRVVWHMHSHVHRADSASCWVCRIGWVVSVSASGCLFTSSRPSRR
jgi:hypothetical protein